MSRIPTSRAVLVIVLIATFSTLAYAGAKCWSCNGTGWKGQQKCLVCGGDGEIGN